MTTFPTNIDDAFVEGWNFGRYGKPEYHHVMTAHNSTVAVRREYERGVPEGHAFQTHEPPFRTAREAPNSGRRIVGSEMREDCDGQTHVFPRR